jgi:ubiquinone/menaquinone biosynthesis C-methylase UbiE
MDGDRNNLILQRFYRWNAPIYDLTRWTILRFRRQAVEALRLSRGMKVLEVGCGTGLSFGLIARRISEGGVLVGVDLSEDMLRRAARRAKRQATRPGEPKLQVICADAATLRLDVTFDAALMSYSLSMIPNWESAIGIAAEHVREGGTIVILDFGRPHGYLTLMGRAFAWYLALSHVDTGRDFESVLRRHVQHVEVIRPTTSYATLLRGTR